MCNARNRDLIIVANGKRKKMSKRRREILYGLADKLKASKTLKKNFSFLSFEISGEPHARTALMPHGQSANGWENGIPKRNMLKQHQIRERCQLWLKTEKLANEKKWKKNEIKIHCDECFFLVLISFASYRFPVPTARSTTSHTSLAFPSDCIRRVHLLSPPRTHNSSTVAMY